jgi:hypothetical protein
MRRSLPKSSNIVKPITCRKETVEGGMNISPPIELVPIEIWKMIFKNSIAKEIINFCVTCKSTNKICKNENLWKFQLEIDYPFAKTDDLSLWNIIYDDDIFASRPNYETYKVIHCNITEWDN